MRKISYKFLFGAALLATLASCGDDDDATLSTRLVKPVVSVAVSATQVTEGDPITITLTADKAIDDVMRFKLEVLPTSTGGFRDLTSEDATETVITDGYGGLGYYVTIPAYTTTYTFTITPEVDLEVEGTETFNFRLYGAGNSKGKVASEFFTVDVANKVTGDFVAKLDWSQTTADTYGTLNPGTYVDVDDNSDPYCDFDFDMEIYTAGFDLWSYSCADCPEVASILEADPDGQYLIVPSFFTKAGPTAPKSGDINFKADVTMGRPGAFKTVINMDGKWSYVAGGVDDGNADAIIPVAVVTKTGSTYLVEDYNTGEVLGQGRMANIRQILASKIRAKK